jgi:hypothetical protein
MVSFFVSRGDCLASRIERTASLAQSRATKVAVSTIASMVEWSPVWLGGLGVVGEPINESSFQLSSLVKFWRMSRSDQKVFWLVNQF